MTELEAELESELEAALELELEGEEEFAAEEEWESEYEQSISPSALYEIIGRDTRVRVANTTLAPFRYICNLEYDFPAATHPGVGTRAMCSGTLIGPSTILTAGHCMSGLDPRRMRIIPGRNGALEPLPATQAVAFHLAPSFREASPTDYGIIHLRHPIGNRVGYWTVGYSRSSLDPVGTSILARPASALRLGQIVNISGYPADKPDGAGCTRPTQPRNRCFHSALNDPRRQRSCGTFQYLARNVSIRPQRGMLEYQNDTCPGHSGSPIWIENPPNAGGRTLIGVHVAGDDRATPGIANRGVPITPQVMANIQRWLRTAPVPPPIRMPPTRITVRPFRVLDRFQFNRATLSAHHPAIIEQIARAVVANARAGRPIRTIRLVGHTDTAGPAAYNLNLGRQRATAVQRRLTLAIERLQPGLTRSIRFIPQTLGERRPAASNSTAAGRARNRRVAVFLSRV
jgi:V8-like Glu-specific endopeptidase